MRATAYAEARICWGAATFVQNLAGEPIMAPEPRPVDWGPPPLEASQRQLRFSCIASPRLLRRRARPGGRRNSCPYRSRRRRASAISPAGGSADAFAVGSPTGTKPSTTRIHPLVSSPPAKLQRPKGVSPCGPPPTGGFAGIGQNVLPVTESAATECADGCRSEGGLLIGAPV